MPSGADLPDRRHSQGSIRGAGDADMVSEALGAVALQERTWGGIGEHCVILRAIMHTLIPSGFKTTKVRHLKMTLEV